MDHVTKLPPPQATGKGSGRPLAAMSIMEINSAAATAHDPFRGNILQESDPRAQAFMRKNAQRIIAAQAAQKGIHTSHKKKGYHLGDRVLHNKRGQGNIVGSLEGKRIEVIFASGDRAMVQVANLERV